MFNTKDREDKLIRKRVILDCSEFPDMTEQQHKEEVDINNIVKKHGVDLIAQTQALVQLKFDDNPDNDFSEMMNMMIKAQDSFDSLPSQLRNHFKNDPAAFMDFVRDDKNTEQLIEWGLANAPEDVAPIQVTVVPTEAAETPIPATSSEPNSQ